MVDAFSAIIDSPLPYLTEILQHYFGLSPFFVHYCSSYPTQFYIVMWALFTGTMASATMALFHQSQLTTIKACGIDLQVYFPHHNTNTSSSNNNNTANKMSSNSNTTNNKHEEEGIDFEFEMIENKEIEEIQSQQARAALGIRPSSSGGSGGRIFKKVIRSVALTAVGGAMKVAEKMTDKTKTSQEPTPEQALCPCLADPVNGWRSCKIYGHVRAKLIEKGIVIP
ncbi:hypothetical protein IWZ00DRAFT_247467 [Phyllosticta capitalensis]